MKDKKEMKFSAKNLVKNTLRFFGLCSWPAILATSIGLCAGFAVAKNKIEGQFKEAEIYQNELAKAQAEVDNLEKKYLETKSDYELGNATLKQLDAAKTEYEHKSQYANSSSFTMDVMKTTMPELYAEHSKDATISFVSGFSIGMPQLFPGAFFYAAASGIDTDDGLCNFDPLYVEDERKERNVAKLQAKLEKLQAEN